jgi:Zn-dependent protease
MTFVATARQGLGMAAICAVIGGLVLTLSLTAHEAGHLLLGRRARGITPRILLIRSLGGVSIVEGHCEDPRGAALFAAGGPLASLLVGISLVTGGLFLPDPFSTALILPGALTFALLVVNLLPLAPMDGYLLFRAAVWAELGSRAEAERRAIDWSRAVLGWSIFISLGIFLHSSLYGLLALFLVGSFIVQHQAVARRVVPARPRHRSRY